MLMFLLFTGEVYKGNQQTIVLPYQLFKKKIYVFILLLLKLKHDFFFLH